MAKRRQHEPLRIPENWRGQDRSFVMQLERLLDDIYGHMDNKDAWESVYPVGAIYLSAEDTEPSRLFGGEWEAVTNSLNLYMWKRCK